MPSALARLRELPPELRNAGIAAAALALSLLLPWYERSVPVGGTFAQRNVSAFGVFTFVEAAVLLVAAGVLFLVWARSEKKGFHLPGGDGTAIALAGGWAMLLLIWRLFDKPDARTGGDYGLQWGIVAALAAAGALLAAGLRVRAAHRPEPPLPAADDVEPPPQPRPARRPADPAAVTEVLGERPDWSGEPPEAPRRAARAGETPAWYGEPPEAPGAAEAPPSAGEPPEAPRAAEAPTSSGEPPEAPRAAEAPTSSGEPPKAPRRALRGDEAPDWSGEPPEAPGWGPRGDEAPTRRVDEADEAPTRRIEADEEPTRRLEGGEARPRRGGDEAPTRRGDDDRRY